MQQKISKIKLFLYLKRIITAMIFVFLLPVYLFFYGLKFGLELLGIGRPSLELLLPFMPFIAFIFVTVFLFNGSFWLGFFSEDSDLDFSSEDSDNSLLSLFGNDINMDK